MTDIWTVMPTRGRPIRATAVWQSHQRTRVMKDTILTWVLDTEDAKVEEYYTARGDEMVSVLEFHGNMVERTNKAASGIARLYPDSIIGWCADDNEFVTPGWDDKVREAFQDPKVGFVVPNDNHWKGDKAGVVWTRASIVKALDYLALPTQEHLYVDDAWITLARETESLRYLSDVVVLHHNPFNTGIGQPDEQGKHTNRPELYTTDGMRYHEWLNGDGLYNDARKVRSALSV